MCVHCGKRAFFSLFLLCRCFFSYSNASKCGYMRYCSLCMCVAVCLLISLIGNELRIVKSHCICGNHCKSRLTKWKSSKIEHSHRDMASRIIDKMYKIEVCMQAESCFIQAPFTLLAFHRQLLTYTFICITLSCHHIWIVLSAPHRMYNSGLKPKTRIGREKFFLLLQIVWTTDVHTLLNVNAPEQ